MFHNRTILVLALLALIVVPLTCTAATCPEAGVAVVICNGECAPAPPPTEDPAEKLIGKVVPVPNRTPVVRNSAMYKVKAKYAKTIAGSNKSNGNWTKYRLSGYKYEHIAENCTKYTVFLKGPGQVTVPITMFFNSQTLHPSFTDASIIIGHPEIKWVWVRALKKPAGDRAFLGSLVEIDPMLGQSTAREERIRNRISGETFGPPASGGPAPAKRVEIHTSWEPTPCSKHVAKK